MRSSATRLHSFRAHEAAGPGGGCRTRARAALRAALRGDGGDPGAQGTEESEEEEAAELDSLELLYCLYETQEDAFGAPGLPRPP